MGNMETHIRQKRRICVLIMLVLMIPSTLSSTVSIAESITESSLTNKSLSKKTCYKCFNCATFVAVQAKECDNPEEQFCSKEIKSNTGEVTRQCASKKMCEKVGEDENIFCCDSDKCNEGVIFNIHFSLLLLSILQVPIFSSS